MYRVKQFIILLLPTITIIFAIYLVKEYNKGYIVIHDTNQSITTIKEQQYVIDTDEYKISLWPGEYNLDIKKVGYQRFNRKIQLVRGDTIDIYPDLVFIPTMKEVEQSTPYIIPDEFKSKNEKGEIIYQDNQYRISFLDIDKKTLHNLPNNILFIVFSRDGENACIITNNDDLELADYYYYSLKTEELHVLENDINLSGITWSKSGKKLSYIKPTSDTDSSLFIYDTESLEKTEVTKLYSFQSAYSMFTLQDSHIIILPIDNTKDLIDVNINTERKKKLTFSESIENMKTTDSGVFYTEVQNDIKRIKYLDLVQNGLINLPSTVTDINQIELLENNIIYSHLDSSLFEDGVLNNKYIENIARKAETSKDSFYIFDTKHQTETFIKSLNPGQQVDKFLDVLKESTELIFTTKDGKYYNLKLTK